MTKNNYFKSTPIFLAFLVMGFGDVSGPLTSQLQTDFSLSNFQAGLVTFMAFLMFGLLSIPMGLYQDRKGRKHVLLMGLFAALIGMILPIIGNYESFPLILGGLLFLGTGATLLQVAGNPIMRDVSPEGKYSRNLSFGQFVKAIGSLSGSLIPILAARYWGLDWKILFPIYGAVMLVATDTPNSRYPACAIAEYASRRLLFCCRSAPTLPTVIVMTAMMASIMRKSSL